ncbi:hypothetical protein EYF80_025119 [Liparis tanakae]|uniref:Uncharacterized protein n=1 Tax=Liparis tanakae TaxID=230148 RepID=A0A4Z2HGE9_9TELE|nr:hypothetical protein EYF80_025119 [Liparis tanakae]
MVQRLATLGTAAAGFIESETKRPSSPGATENDVAVPMGKLCPSSTGSEWATEGAPATSLHATQPKPRQRLLGY